MGLTKAGLKSRVVLISSGRKRALRKHACSNISKISRPKTENFPIRNSDAFHISAPNAVLTNIHIYVLSRNKKNNVYPCKPHFYYI